MIELNLLPEELKKKKKRIELPEIPFIPISIALIAALVVIQLLLSGWIAATKSQISSLEKTWKDLAPKKTEFESIKKKISAITGKAQTIEYLIDKRVSWARFLNELSDSVTSNVWLTGLSYSEKSGVPVTRASSKIKTKSSPNPKTKTRRERTLTISGSASGRGEEATAYIARFIQSLKDNGDFFKNFNDIELVSIKQDSVADQNVMDFNLACRFKPDAAGD
ncbi:MAG: PilN domain-containing protein [Candidatus Omnitrophica bacterium]|nr:PilN domain-containing protein [Candidatus Omnitrophota bacterium]